MQINWIKFKNFMSYGNKYQIINFETLKSNSKNSGNRLILITGPSGVGKSAISYIIEFGLYGRVRNRKLSDLPNRLNKNLEVQINVKCDNQTFTIFRSINPNKFSIEFEDKNFERHFLQDQAKKKDIQSYLEEKFFKIPFQIFTNILTLSIDDFKSFINLNPKDKRDIFDKIFGLSLINEMFEILKNESRQQKEQEIILKNKLEFLDNQIQKTKSYLSSLIKQIKKENNELKQRYQSKIANLKDLRIKIDEVYSKVKQIIKEKTIHLMSIQEQIQKNNNLLQRINEKINLYQQSKCPLCETEFNTSFYQSLLSSYELERMKIIDLNNELNSQYDKLSKKMKLYKQKEETFKQKIQKIDFLINSFIQKLKDLDSSSQVSKEISSLMQVLKDTKMEKRVVKKENDNLFKKSNLYKILEEILGERGIKAIYIKNILPNFNQNINFYLRKLNLDYTIFFNEEFDCIINHLGMRINIETLSTGEQKRVNFAVLISILQLIKLKHPTINLLFIDELFASIDTLVVYEITKILKDISQKINLNIFVINHAPIDNSYFTHILKVEKINGFSNLSWVDM